MTSLDDVLTPTLTVETRGNIATKLWVWFNGTKKAPIHDLPQRMQSYYPKILKLSKSLSVKFEGGKYAVVPGIELQTYTELTRGALWFDGNRDEIDALIISEALEGAL